MSSENPRYGEVDPTHIGPPDLILQEIVAPSEVPEDVRKRVETFEETGERGRVIIARIGTGVLPLQLADHSGQWADVTFAGTPRRFVIRLPANSDYNTRHDGRSRHSQRTGHVWGQLRR